MQQITTKLQESIVYQIGKNSNEVIVEILDNKNYPTYKDILNRKLKSINSYGIILYYMPSITEGSVEPKFLLAQLKDSYAYIDFIKNNIPSGQTRKYIDMMTTEEKNRISNNMRNFQMLWMKLWTVNNMYSPYYISRFKECYCRFLINIHQHGDYIIKTKDDGLNSSSWIFPKGRLHKYESILECAVREFYEETRISSSRIEIQESFQENKMYQETYIGTDGKLYYSGYFIAQYKGYNLPINNYMTNNNDLISNEIKELKWVGIEEALLLLEDEKKRSMLKCLYNSIISKRKYITK